MMDSMRRMTVATIVSTALVGTMAGTSQARDYFGPGLGNNPASIPNLCPELRGSIGPAKVWVGEFAGFKRDFPETKFLNRTACFPSLRQCQRWLGLASSLYSDRQLKTTCSQGAFGSNRPWW